MTKAVGFPLYAALLSLATHAGAESASPDDIYQWVAQLEGPWVLSAAERQEGNATKRPEVAAMVGTQQVAMNFQMIGRRSTVQEDLLPGTERQMVTMYHCADSDCSAVKATHYCAKQNQPEFLASPDSRPDRLVFECDMSTELCASWDDHIHRITHEISEDGAHLRSVYSTYLNGEHTRDTIFHFDRQ